MADLSSISTTPVVLTPTGGVAGVVTGGATSAVASRPTQYPLQIIGLVPLSPCDLDECRTFNGDCYVNDVFGTLNAVRSGYENDFSTFFLYDAMRRVTVFTIQKLDTRLKVWNDEAIIGSTLPALFVPVAGYGTMYTWGYFSGQPKYLGFQINWGGVLTMSGPGTYRLEVSSPTTVDEQNKPYPYCLMSEHFNLMPFSCELANGTVKFECNNSGKLGSHLSNGLVFDLCQNTFYDSIRFPGFFGRKKGGYDKVQLEYQTGLIDPVRDENILKYQWFSKLLPQWAHDRFMAYAMMADSTFVSDYNMNNSDYNIRLKRIVADGGYEPVFGGFVSVVVEPANV